MRRKEFFNQRKLHEDKAAIILQHVCEYFGLTLEAIRFKRRWDILIIPRFVAMVLMRDHVQGMSLKHIGEMFWEGFDHTTVRNALEVIPKLLDYDEELQEIYQSLIHKINSNNEPKRLHSGRTGTSLRKVS